MKHEPRASITAIVLNFRTPDKTIKCLRSLAEQEIEHIVMVDNSEDQDSALHEMQPAIDDLRQAGINLEVLSEGRNLGFAAGINLALAHVNRDRSSDILLLNSDARLLDGCLSALSQALRRGAAAAAPVQIDPCGIVRSSISFYQKHTGILSTRRLPGSISYLTGACMLLSREIAKEQLLDEDFFFYGEDVMLGAWMQKRGLPFVATTEAQVFHEGAGSSHNGSPFYEYHISRGHWLLAAKLAKNLPSHLLNLAGRGIFLFARATFRSIRHRSTLPLRSTWIAAMDVARNRLKTMTPFS